MDCKGPLVADCGIPKQPLLLLLAAAGVPTGVSGGCFNDCVWQECCCGVQESGLFWDGLCSRLETKTQIPSRRGYVAGWPPRIRLDLAGFMKLGSTATIHAGAWELPIAFECIL